MRRLHKVTNCQSSKYLVLQVVVILITLFDLMFVHALLIFIVI